MLNMNSIVLDEVVRWQHHHDRLDSNPVLHEQKQILSRPVWWKEIGAFVSMPGRQTGKSTLANHLYDRFSVQDEKVIVLTIFKTQIDLHFKGKNAFIAGDFVDMRGQDCSDTHLIIDEFTYIPKDILDQILDTNWKSVSMFGTVI